jgi:hypothetical protein
MIISASRRTDIPAFYAPWFINRIRAGFCTVPNPFNPNQVMRVSLAPEDVEVIVFWTRNPRPLFPYLQELDERGYCYYFQYTLMKNPRALDANVPTTESAVGTFRQLSEQIGSQKVIWRYDPIVFSELTPPDFHRRSYQYIAQELRGYTHRSVISMLDFYPKLRKRLGEMEKQGAALLPFDSSQPWFDPLVRDLVASAWENEMEVVSCAEELDLQSFGICPGKCIDDETISQVFGLDVTHLKDPGQRKACGCVVSKDIGMYDTCLFGCRYCYATSSFERARINYQRHDPRLPSLLA